ncbi:MAG: class III poly(R)-hydroxyalkanoic acid synthase subunit PhaC [Nitrospirae bacterium]|uniref:class III poly(R)-hydroxyalkanoic acid synthase subunit PhaC n=1 Tax=Candidatus Magnetobacterium casense TaxID=1455061 RepID=UPI000696652A|nr:class III poly(R)-hydroxyalkanoic acid synthase subunit PhaC [Candidatus Magnetobacterium casensis]MBF0338330.1 class III poly(R)-hydroxyalkanoic acid synthase subunit PhaC [Nitrospirota bacterium]
MKTPFLTFDTKNIAKEMVDMTQKMVKGSETFMNIEDIDVGISPKELVYQQDKMKLYHYKNEGNVTCKVPVLIVYALVNKEYMLDLQPDRSIVRNLLNHGVDLYIIDWGYPTRADRYVSLDDYINVYLNDAVDFIRESSNNDKINLMGICQGGTFSTMFSAIYPEKVKNLITLVTPIDFSIKKGLLFNWSRNINADTLIDTYGVIPGDFLNSGFLMLMPITLNVGKYIGMLDVVESKEKLLNFLRMEKWIFDSPDQAGECLKQFIKDMYQENKLVKGTLKIGDKDVDLKNISMPLLNIYANADHIVPPDATKPLNDLVSSTDKELYEFKGGHIGVFVGGKSQKELAPAISAWLHKRADSNGQRY